MEKTKAQVDLIETFDTTGHCQTLPIQENERTSGVADYSIESCWHEANSAEPQEAANATEANDSTRVQFD
jgi:hypothetical protein